MKHFYIYIILVFILLISCKKNMNFGPQTDQVIDDVSISVNGAFVINEGLYGANNGSLSYIDLDSLKINNHIFQNANDQYLGDVPQSVSILNNKAYIVINHTAKLYIVDLANISLIQSVSGFNSPRYICQVTSDKAYISDLYSDSLVIFDINNYTITGYINIGRSSEKMLFHKGYAYILNWSNYGNASIENKKVVKIDVNTDQVVSEIEVTKEPNSIILDKNDKLWVLCSGGYDNSEFPALIRINPDNDQIELQLDFPTISSSPTSLCVNHTKDTLFYINGGIYQHHINSNQLESSPIIEENGNTYYNIACHPDENKILISDVKNYSSQGQVHIYKTSGTHITSLDAGIIPGDIKFY
jgi:hypothetical protein